MTPEVRQAEAVARLMAMRAKALRLRELTRGRKGPVQPGTEEHRLTGELARMVLEMSASGDDAVLEEMGRRGTW